MAPLYSDRRWLNPFADGTPANPTGTLNLAWENVTGAYPYLNLDARIWMFTDYTRLAPGWCPKFRARASSEASSSLDCGGSLLTVSYASLATAPLFMRSSASPVSCASFIGKTGSCMPSRLSAAPNMCCIIWLATHTSVAISNHRLLSVSASEVHFRWKDYAHGNKQRTMTLTSQEFLRRFVQHILPRGFPRIRYFGWLSNRRRTRILPLCRARLNQAPSAEMPSIAKPTLWTCPHCHGLMHLVERLSSAQLFFIERKEFHAFDSS